MQKSIQSSQLMQQIASLIPSYCDRCGFRHSKSDMEIVNEENDKVVLKLECSNCKNIYLFHISSPVDGVLNAKRAPFKVDISAAELKKFSNSEKIMNDEVLDVFIAMKGVSNIKDFNVLFDKESNDI